MDGIQQELESGVREGVYPGVVLVVGCRGEIVFSGCAGRTSAEPPGREVEEETLFDLGSLTKPLVTTLAMMRLVDLGGLELDQPIAEILPGVLSADKRPLTPRLLLCHAAGFPDWRDYYRRLEGVAPEERKLRCRAWILEDPLVYVPGQACVYSDPGFMLLEWVVEQVAGMDMGNYVESLFCRPLGLERLFLFRRDQAPRFPKGDFAATEHCPWRKRTLQGEVHDENAFALGGFSGHAGLFGTAEQVWALAYLLQDHAAGERFDLLHPQTVRSFFQRQEIVPGCSRALGWDTPSAEGSSAGTHFSSATVGHLGFPGTSLWMDLEQNVQVILLTNRVHPSRKNRLIQDFRPRIHNRVMEELGL